MSGWLLGTSLPGFLVTHLRRTTDLIGSFTVFLEKYAILVLPSLKPIHTHLHE